MTHRFFPAQVAGVRRAPAACVLAALLAATPVAAGTSEPKPNAAAAPAPEESPFPTPADLAGRGEVRGPVISGVRPLRVLAAEASAIVVAATTRTETFDEDKLRLVRLRVERVLRGRLDDPEPGVVDMRAGSRRPPVLADGEHVVVLLRPAPQLSYLADHLPEGPRWVAVSGRDGVIPIATDADVDAVEHALADGAASGSHDGAAARKVRRRLALREIASRNPRLVTDALVELRSLEKLGPLAPADVDALKAVLQDERLDAPTRIGLIDLLRDRLATDALPALRSALVDTPAVLNAVFAARAALGESPGMAELRDYLNGSDPSLRAVAVRALARLDDPAAIDQVGHYATSDADLKVREAAVEALGATGRPAALPILSRTFDAPERELKQGSARAMLAIGGEAADDALVSLALNGSSTDTRKYAALLLLMSRGRDAPAIRRIEQSNPSPEVKHVIEKGLEETER